MTMTTEVAANNPMKVIKDKKTVTSWRFFYYSSKSYVSRQGLFMRNHQALRFSVVCSDKVDAVRVLGG